MIQVCVTCSAIYLCAHICVAAGLLARSQKTTVSDSSVCAQDLCAVPTHTHACTHARTHTRTHAHARTHTHTNTCTRTHTHTHTHTQVLCVGPTGTGKTLTAADKLIRGMPDKYMSDFLNFSARTSANQTQDIIDAKLDKRCVRVSIFLYWKHEDTI